MVRDSDIVVAIGYSFNAHDLGSYQTLLDALRVIQGPQVAGRGTGCGHRGEGESVWLSRTFPLIH